MQLITRTMSRKYARTKSCLPLQEVDGELHLAVTNPWDRDTFENLSRAVALNIVPVLCSKADIQRAITNVHGFKHSVNAAVDDTNSVTYVSNLEQLVDLKDHGELEATDRPIVNAVE